MPQSQLPNSIRKFLRKEKARFRREILNYEEAEKKIQQLVTEIFEEYSNKKDRH